MRSIESLFVAASLAFSACHASTRSATKRSGATHCSSHGARASSTASATSTTRGSTTRRSSRSPLRITSTPLKGLWTHQNGGFYHDGRFTTLLDVVNHYDDIMDLGLSGQEKAALVEYLKSI